MSGIFKKWKTLIGIAVLGVVLYFAYTTLVAGPVDDGVDSPAEQEARALENELLAELERLQKIELSSDLFASPAFGTLVDFSEPLPTPVVGRDNPFAPRGVAPVASPTEEPATEDEVVSQ